MNHATQMDPIDQQQQREIDSNRVWIKVVAVLCTLLTIAAICIFALISNANNCPHPDCPHHHAQAN